MILVKKNRPILLMISLSLAIISAVATGVLFFWYRQAYNCKWEEAKKSAIDQTLKASKELIGFMEMLKPIVASIADELSKKNFTVEEIEHLLQSKKVDEVTSVGVAFSPYMFDKKEKLFGRSVIEKEGKIETVKLEGLYDYTKDAWFNNPFKDGEGFLDPYHNEEIGVTVAEYSMPIYRTDADGKKVPVGVVFANQSLNHLQHIIEQLFLGRSGYWMILTEKGSFLAYPQSKYKSKTIFDIADDLRNKELSNAANKIMKGQSVVFEYNNEITGAPSWLISEPISGTPWSVVGVFDQGELNLDSNLFRHKLIIPSLSFLFSIIFLIMFMMLLHRKRSLEYWGLAMTGLSCGILMQIAWLWCAIYAYPFKLHEPNVSFVEDSLQLFEYLKKNVPSNDPAHKDVTIRESLLKMMRYKEYVPMGIYINNLQFSEANEIKFSAYVWQRFSKGLHDKLPRGFTLTQTNEANIQEESKFFDRGGKDEIITYDVFAKLNQFLTYTLYPFDVKSLRIMYWPKTTDQDMYFIPDLDAYKLINPKSLPGIDPDVYIPGWTIIGSYFGYEKSPYTTNFGAYSVGSFGIYREQDLSAQAQPFFEMVIRRNLVDALISDLIPIVVIALLLFLVLFTHSGGDSYLTPIASIFFATIFAHIRFRSKIPQAQIVYLESLYFILYLLILLVLIVCFLAQFKIKIKYLTLNNDLMIKMFYWPFFLGTFAVISLLYLW